MPVTSSHFGVRKMTIRCVSGLNLLIDERWLGGQNYPMKYILAFFSALFVILCTPLAQAQESLPEPDIFVLFMLFHDTPGVDGQLLFSKHNAGKVSIVPSLENHPGSGVEIRSQTVGQGIELPPEQILQYFGRGFDEKTAADFLASKYATVVIGAGPHDKNHTLFRNVNLTVGKMANELGAYVMDGQDSQVYIPQAFADLRLAEIKAGDLSVAQFGVRAYPHENKFRGVTMGLDKFGQHNFVVPSFEGHQVDRVNALMELVSQYFIEADVPIEPGNVSLDFNRIKNAKVREHFTKNKRSGVKGKATIRLDFLESVSGDPDVLLGPVFADGQTLESVLQDLFGQAEKRTEGVSMEELQGAIGAARGRAVAILNDFEKLRLSGHRMSVAIDLVEPKEVVWAEVTEWKNGQGKAILLTGAGNRTTGSNITFTPNVIMDFKLMGNDGMVETGGIDELVKRLK